MQAREQDSRMAGMALFTKRSETQKDWATDWDYLLSSDRGATRLYFEPIIRHQITPFHMAIAKGCPIDTMKELLRKHPQLVNCATDGGDLPLHYAAASHEYNIVHLLIKKDPHASESLQHASRATGAFGNQVLPLHVAIATQAPESIVSLLLKHCPSTAVVKNGNGKSPIAMVNQSYEGASFRTVTKALMKARWKQTKKSITSMPSRSFDSDSVATGDSSVGDSKSFQGFWDTVNWEAPDVGKTNGKITFGDRKKGRSVSATKIRNMTATQIDDEHADKALRRSSMPANEATLHAKTDDSVSRRNSAPVAPTQRSKSKRSLPSLDDLFQRSRNDDASRQSRQELDELSNTESKLSRDQSTDGPLLKRLDESRTKKRADSSQRSRRHSSDAVTDSQFKKLDDSKDAGDVSIPRRKSIPAERHRSSRSLRSSRRTAMMDTDASRSRRSLRSSSAIEIKQEQSPRRRPDEDLSNKGKLAKLLETAHPRSASPFEKKSSKRSIHSASKSTRSSTRTSESKDRNGDTSILHTVRDQMRLEQDRPVDEALEWKDYRATKRVATPDSTPLRGSRSATPTSRSSSRSINSEATGKSTESILRLPKNPQSKTGDRWTQVLEEGLKDLSMHTPDTTPSRRRSVTPTELRGKNCFSTKSLLPENTQDIRLVEDKNMKVRRRQQQRRRSSATRQSSEPSFAKLIDALSPPREALPKSKSDRGLRGATRTQESRKDLNVDTEDDKQLEPQSSPHEVTAQSLGRGKVPIQDLATTSKGHSTRRLQGERSSSQRRLHRDKITRSRKDVRRDSTRSIKSNMKESTPSTSADNNKAADTPTTTSKRESPGGEHQAHEHSSREKKSLQADGSSLPRRPSSRSRAFPQEAEMLFDSLNKAPSVPMGSEAVSMDDSNRERIQLQKEVFVSEGVEHDEGIDRSERSKKSNKKKSKKKKRHKSSRRERRDHGDDGETEGEMDKSERSRHTTSSHVGDDNRSKRTSTRHRRSSHGDDDKSRKSTKSSKSRKSTKSSKKSRRRHRSEALDNEASLSLLGDIQQLTPEVSPVDVFLHRELNESMLSEMSADEMTDHSSSTGMTSSASIYSTEMDASSCGGSVSSYATDSSAGTTKTGNSSSTTKQKKKLRFQTPPATTMHLKRLSDDDHSGYPMPYMMSAMK